MDVLAIFYNQILKEAATGRISSYFKYNILFNSKVPEMGIDEVSTYDNSRVLVPTLRINDVSMFNEYLLEYVRKALKFYMNELLDMEDIELQVKTLMALLWSNATIDDFSNPVDFLKRRIDYFDADKLMEYDGFSFYADSLNSLVTINVEKSKLANETPYRLSITLSNDEGEKFYLPSIYLGISDSCSYIYAIQNEKSKINDGSYAKKIGRMLYKVNDGLDVKNDTYENYGDGNLKDVSSSFVLASNIAMGVLHDMGIKHIVIPSILITRWNGREISNDVKRSYNRLDLVEDDEKLEQIQSNLTEKFLRTFRRLDYHHSGINVSSFPFDSDTSMHLVLSDEDICNNKILQDTYSNICNKKSNTL